MTQYVSPKTIRQEFEILPKALQTWAKKGYIKYIVTPQNRYLYDIESIRDRFGLSNNNERTKVIYARVSSSKQEDDLERQIKFLEKHYPNHTLIKDIGSGINFKRKGFQKLLERVMSNDVEEIVVTYKDRLSRFGYDLIETICNRFNTTILVHHKEVLSTPQDEMAQDLLAIVNVFVAKNNGRRSHLNKKDKTVSNNKAKEIS